MNRRKILAFTGIRSEYDLQFPIAKELNCKENVQFGFVVFGAHLSEKFGSTVQVIEKDGFRIISRIANFIEDDSHYAKAKSSGVLMVGCADVFRDYQPDIVLVVGDREETIIASIIASYFNVPIAHVFGGDYTFPESLGDVDEQIRNATTKLAHLHFVIHEEHKQRIIKMGEEPWRVFNTGSPGQDKYVEHQYSIDAVNQFFHVNLKPKEYAVLIHHSLPNNLEECTDEIRNILSALHKRNIITFILYPNSDPGYQLILNSITTLAKNKEQFILSKSLEREIFIPLIKHARFLIGNSSMGILEAPFLELPAINVGKRQQQRLNAGNVIFTGKSQEEIEKAMDIIFYDEKFIHNLRLCKLFYGDGNSGKRIADILSSIKIDNNLLAKRNTY